MMKKEKGTCDNKHPLPYLLYKSDYFFPASICSFKAARASMSPKVVEAAWF
jgi:hypothetical protein